MQELFVAKANCRIAVMKQELETLTIEGDRRALAGAIRELAQAVEVTQENGKVEATAKKLGIPRSSLYQMIKQWNLSR